MFLKSSNQSNEFQHEKKYLYVLQKNKNIWKNVFVLLIVISKSKIVKILQSSKKT